MSVDVFFPMAGRGVRFGGTFKPFLKIGPDHFIEAAVRPFLRHRAQIGRFVFVYLEEQERAFDVERQLRAMFTDLPIEIVRLDRETRGPAETISRAIQQLGATGPAFFCDCDHELDVAPLFDLVTRGDAFDVILPVWPLEPDNLASWSVAMVHEGRVHAVAEKRMPAGSIGTPMGVIGCYGFADIADIARRADALAAINFSDVISRMLAEDKIIRAAQIERAIFFGDPQRLQHATTQTTTKEPA